MEYPGCETRTGRGSAYSLPLPEVIESMIPADNRVAVVADGYDRAVRAHEPAIRQAVEQEFATRIREAAFWRRWWIRRLMRVEIKRRLDEVAPAGGLY